MKNREEIIGQKPSFQKVTVAAIQMQVFRTFEENLEESKKALLKAKKSKIQVAVLPEYFAYPLPDKASSEDLSEYGKQTVAYLERISRELNIMLIGNAVISENNKIYNTVFIYHSGKLLGIQKKLNLAKREADWGITPGTEINTFETNIGKIGVLVCGDILFPELAEILFRSNVEIVFNPVISYRYENDIYKSARESMFIGRCFDNNFYLIKAGGYSTDKNSKIIGRSLICAPWGIIKKAKHEQKSEVVLAKLEIDKLHSTRHDMYWLKKRLSR